MGNILAKIDEVVITDEDIDNILIQYPEKDRIVLNTEKGRKKILDKLISCELLAMYGKSKNYHKSEEYINSINFYSRDLLVKMVLDKEIDDVNVSEKEILEFYNDNIERYEAKELVTAKHILVETYEEAKNIKNKIDNNELEFNTAVMRYSICPSSMQGGNLGTFPRGKMVKEFEEIAFDIEANKLSEPVKTEFGYHLILVEKKEMTHEKKFEDVKNDILIELKKKYSKEKYNKILNKLEEKVVRF